MTSNILSQIEKNFSGLKRKELNNRVSFIQAEFTHAIESMINPANQPYSVDLHLIKPSGELVADYSTDLNSPNWVSIFDLRCLSTVIEMQQITRTNNRPVVQLSQLKNQGDYDTFYRGWIPLFGNTSSDPIAWILCSIYKERPDFNKPILAVMASVKFEDWKISYRMLDYRNGRLYRSATQGLAGYYSVYNKLRQSESAAPASRGTALQSVSKAL